MKRSNLLPYMCAFICIGHMTFMQRFISDDATSRRCIDVDTNLPRRHMPAGIYGESIEKLNTQQKCIYTTIILLNNWQRFNWHKFCNLNTVITLSTGALSYSPRARDSTLYIKEAHCLVRDVATLYTQSNSLLQKLTLFQHFVESVFWASNRFLLRE